MLLLLILTAVAPHAAATCASEGNARVCWDGSTGVEVEQPTAVGTASAETYTARREGSHGSSYTVTRDGATVAWKSSSLGNAAVDVHRAEYEQTSGSNSVRVREVRASTGSDSVAVGLKHATYGSAHACSAYVEDLSVATPCTPAHP